MCGREPNQASDDRYLAREIDELIEAQDDMTFASLMNAVAASGIYLNPRGEEVATNRVETALRRHREAMAGAAQTSLLDLTNKCPNSTEADNG